MVTRNLDYGDRDCRVQFFVASRGGPPRGPAARVNIEEALLEAASLPRHVVGDGGRCAPTRNGHLLVLDVHDCSAGFAFAFGDVNLTDLPSTATRDGEIRALDLESGRGLLSSTHCVTFGAKFPDLIGCIPGMGPDVTRLADYLASRCPSVGGKFRIEPLMDADIAGALSRMQAVSLFRLRIDPSQVPVIRGHWDNLDARLDADLALYAEQKYLDVRLEPVESARSRALSSLQERVLSLLGATSLLARGSVFQIKGPLDDLSARDVVVDLVGRKLSVPVSVAKERSGHSALHKWSAYPAIREAYSTLQSDIDAAMATRAAQVVRNA